MSILIISKIKVTAASGEGGGGWGATGNGRLHRGEMGA